MAPVRGSLIQRIFHSASGLSILFHELDSTATLLLRSKDHCPTPLEVQRILRSRLNEKYRDLVDHSFLVDAT